MNDKGLLVNLEIHHEYQGTGGLCNNQSSNWFFTKTIYSVVTFCSLTMTFLPIFILLLFHHEKKYTKRCSYSSQPLYLWPHARAASSQRQLDRSMTAELELMWSWCLLSPSTLQAMQSILPCFWNSPSGSAAVVRKVSLPTPCHLSLSSILRKAGLCPEELVVHMGEGAVWV